MFVDLQNDDCKRKYSVKLELCNISSDRPNINKAVYRNFDEKLKDMDFKGLLPFFSCTVHVVHNGFRRGIETLQINVDTLAFDLHAWIKTTSCKAEYLKVLSESTTIHDESLFL